MSSSRQIIICICPEQIYIVNKEKKLKYNFLVFLLQTMRKVEEMCKWRNEVSPKKVFPCGAGIFCISFVFVFVFVFWNHKRKVEEMCKWRNEVFVEEGIFVWSGKWPGPCNDFRGGQTLLYFCILSYFFSFYLLSYFLSFPFLYFCILSYFLVFHFCILL